MVRIYVYTYIDVYTIPHVVVTFYIGNIVCEESGWGEYWWKGLATTGKSPAFHKSEAIMLTSIVVYYRGVDNNLGQGFLAHSYTTFLQRLLWNSSTVCSSFLISRPATGRVLVGLWRTLNPFKPYCLIAFCLRESGTAEPFGKGEFYAWQ